MNRKRILLTEDSTTNQQVGLIILKKLGYLADIAANGKEALEALRLRSYDLVLMDCQMPEMDGYEACRRIRDPKTDIRNHTIPVIALTGHSMKGDREKCIEAGMNDYITKPLDANELAGALLKWMPAEKGAGSANSSITGGRTRNETDAHDATSTPVFDEEEVIGRLDGDLDLLRIVVAGFLEDLPRQIDILDGHLDAGDLTSARLQAHMIKGAAATIGAEATREAAFKIEQAGKADDIEAMSALLPLLNEQFEKFKQVWERRAEKQNSGKVKWDEEQ